MCKSKKVSEEEMQVVGKLKATIHVILSAIVDWKSTFKSEKMSEKKENEL